MNTQGHAHTPGPWVYDRTLKYYGKEVIRHNGIVLAITDKSGTLSVEEHEQNCALLAAAPAMLEALQLLVKCQNYAMYDGAGFPVVSYELQAVLTQAEQTIEAATGRAGKE